MAQSWVLQCKVDTDLALPAGVSDLTLVSRGPASGDTTEVTRVILRAAGPDLYESRAELDTQDEGEAWELGRRWAYDLVAALSFLGSCRARVRGVSITTAPEKPAAGAKYASVFAADKASAIAPPQVIEPDQFRFLLRLRPERLRRSLVWLHKSRLAQEPVDEFISLLVAFESISGLLKGERTRFWHCESCGRDVSHCPACGASTESRMSGADALRDFTTTKMGWSPSEWRNAWTLRSKLLHGEADGTPEDRREHLPPLLPKLEAAVVVAIKELSGLGTADAPRKLRTRPWFSDAALHVEWTAPLEDEGVHKQDSGRAGR